jgi:predicted transcriptional regulator
MYRMIRTTVYLDERDAAALRRMAAQTGRSQASIIREAVAEAIRPARQRTFRSHGVGRGTGEPAGRHAEDVLREELRRRRR